MKNKVMFIVRMVIVLILGALHLNADSYIVDSQNSTGILLQGDDTLDITPTGSISISSGDSLVTAVESNTTGDIVNRGYISSVSNSAELDDISSGIFQTSGANKITNSGTIDIVATSKATSLGIGQMFDGVIYRYGFYTNNYNIYDGEKGVIVNSGTITLNSYNSAIGIAEIFGDILNSGTIGVNVENSDDSEYNSAIGIMENRGNVVNSGIITLNSQSGTSIGISGDEGNVSNFGTINIESAPRGGSCIHAISNNNDLYVVNEGNISAKISGNYMTGILAFSYSKDIYITNSKEINIENDLDHYSSARGIYSYGFNDQTIVNYGTISSRGRDKTKSISILAMGNADISNYGSLISQSDSGSSVAIEVYSSEDVNISNYGTMVSKSETGKSYGIIIDGYSKKDTDVSNFGSVMADIALDIGVNSSVLNQGIIDTNLMLAQDSDMVNSGTIYLHDTTINSGKSVSKFNTFVQSVSGKLKMDANIVSVDNNISATSSSIEATNGVKIEDGSTIDINLISASNTLTQAFLDANGVIEGIMESNEINVSVDRINICDNSPIVDFEAYMSGQTTLGLKAVRVTKLDPEDTPLSTLSSSMATLETMNSLSSLIHAKQADTRGLNSGDLIFRDKSVWFKPFGIYTKQDDKNGINGFSAHTYGFGIGSDGEYKEGKRVGLSLFYLNADIDTNNIVQTNSVDMFTFVLYGSSPVVDDKTLLLYQIGLGVQRNNSNRYIAATSQTAKADYTSRSFFMQLEVSRGYMLGRGLVVTPALKWELRHLQTPAYSESGAGIFNLNVNSSSATQVVFGLQSNIKYQINDTLKLVSNIALNYDFNNDAKSVDAYFQGAPGTLFSTKGIENSAFGYEFGLGLSKELKRDLMFDFEYNFNGKGDDFTNHSIMAKVKWRF